MDYVKYFRNEAEYYNRKKLKKDLLLAAEVIEKLQQSHQAAPVLGSNSTTLLCARDKAINAMTDLAEVFRSMGVYHYEEMVRGQQKAIRGAVITVENALSSGT